MKFLSDPKYSPIYTLFLGLFLVLAIAYAFPDLASVDGVFYPKITMKIAIVIIFTIYGLTLPGSELVESLRDGKVVLLALGCSFLFYPTVGYLFGKWMLLVGMPWQITDGFVVASCMPPPVSAGIVLTNIYGGDEALAVTISAVGNLLSAVLSPTLIYILFAKKFDLKFWGILRAVLNLIVLVLLPIGLSQAIKAIIPSQFFARQRQRLTCVSKVLMLYLVFCGASMSVDFCDYTGLGPFVIGVLLFSICSIHALVACIIYLVDVKFQVTDSPKKQLSLIFSGSMKSLSTGIAIAIVLCGNDSVFMYYILPLVIFEPLQIIQSMVFGLYFSKHEERTNSMV